ncbi:unnamed protein product [Rotaria socialis]|uniref:ABC transporter domain-containing protein n=2 Tax=Rotaria socialis TaxID=392032 RepID=A0A821AWK2_9BILA|nr:unnamed protein product [Rotaria socialis]
MSLLKQILLVLWKNFTIRRRRWPRVIFELIWPIVLFLILMWIRTRNLTTYYDACYNEPKYLGSTGFLPALQSYMCQWNNTCYNQSSTTDEFNGESSFWRRISSFTDGLSAILNDQQTSSYLSEIFSDLNISNSHGDLWNGTIQATQDQNDFNQSIPNTIITALFENPINLTNLHQSWFLNQTHNSLSNLAVAAQIYLTSMQTGLAYSYQSDIDIQQAFCIAGEFNRTFSVSEKQINETNNFLCYDLPAEDLKSFLISVQQQLDEQFLADAQSNTVQMPVDASKIMHTMNELSRHLKTLNVNFSMDMNNINISLSSLCGGRNDFSSYTNQNNSSNTENNQTQNAPTRATTNASRFDIDWDGLGSDLISYNESEMCLQAYTVTTGSLTKVITINRPCRCVLLNQVFNSNAILRKFLAVLRPILYGKIYYSPSNIYYDNIIKQINQTFESLDELVQVLRQLRLSMKSTLETYQSMCDTFSNLSAMCEQIPTYQRMLTLSVILTEFIACTELNRFEAMNSELDMIQAGQNASLTNNFLAAITFMDDISSNASLPAHVRFKIRMTLDLVDSTFQTADRYFKYAPRTSAPLSTKYHSYTFIYLQNAIERAIISAHTGTNLPYGIKTQQMPYPCWINDQFVNSISRMLPLLMVLSWIFTVSMNVKDIVQEKEKRLKEIMKIMGLKDSVHWFTWFILCTTIMILTAILLVLLLKFGKILKFSNIFVLFLFFIAYTFATITQCFLISVFFNRANLAACGIHLRILNIKLCLDCVYILGAGIIYFLLYLPYTIVINYSAQIKTWQQIIACLSSTVSFGLGCNYIARLEGMAQGIQWFNLNKRMTPNDNFTVLYCIIMMFIDSIIYMLLAIYIENVFPGEFGIPQPWDYPFKKSYWFGFDAQSTDQQQTDVENDQGDVGVNIKNLSKYYGNKMALKDLSVKFYRNMITAFLGRNGAGKSTTWSILTGLIPPSSGTVYVDGYNILTDIKLIRKRLGFAPQYNILFDLLTVKEHLEFFSQLKGTSQELMQSETEKMLIDLTLENKAENYSTALSGGMKRKLSIAIAFIGNSTTVILDEPTAGVDPFARRAIWDLVLKYKPGRTIVLSTHHLDEADLLSDRLAIICSGELKCVGTTMHLKREYGEGYNLIVELKSDETHQQQDNNKHSMLFQQLTDFLRRYMLDINIKEEHGDQITYVIKDDVEHTKVFPVMLAELDENKTKYHVKSYGLSNSGLEQVFLRVADEIKRPEDYERLSQWKKFQNRTRKLFKKEDKPKNASLANENNDEQLQTNTGFSDEWGSHTAERYTGVQFIAVQISALMIKRFHRTKRNTKGFIAEIILPILFILLAILVTKLAPNQSDPPMLILHPWYWNKPNHMFQSLPMNENVSLISLSVKDTFTHSPSLGTRCIKTTIFNKRLYPCMNNGIDHVDVQTNANVMNALNNVNYNQTRISPACDCWEKMQTCPIGSGGPAASYDITNTSDILYDLQGFNITDWLVKTEYDLEYLMARFGGFEFQPNPILNSYDIVSETLINRILNITNQSSTENQASKIASLFRINPPQIAVWYNNKGWPASVAFLNIFNNALLRGLLSQGNSSIDISDYGITAINHPLPQSELQIDSDLLSQATLELFTAICIIFALAFIPASFLVFLIDERVTTSKHLQFVSGVKGITYWSGNLLWDLANYCVSIACCMVIFLIFRIEAYIYKTNFLCLLILLFLYGFSIIPLMYLINYFFTTPSTGFVLISCVNIFIGLITTISTFILESFDDQADLTRINSILKKIFLIFPHYCLGRGLFDMSRIHAINTFSLKYVAGYVPISPFQNDIVGRNLISLFFQGIIFFVLAILAQYRFFIPDRGCMRTPKNLKSTNEDDDVAAERTRIYLDPDNTSRDVLRMVDLVKVYGGALGNNFTAVKKTCVGVKQGECFGLLGINGSGKSTTFKMLTGEISMTDGNAYVNNHSVIKQLDDVRQNIGYCPQFDALDSLLTAREHLYFYARLCGIKQKNIPFITDCLLKRLGLTLWADRPVHQYSGGNKRKLSTAISLIGNPSIIFMDEPTTGMDVRAKRFLWNCILKLTREDRKSVVITSHSMEECETLCNRLVIMVSGEFKCLGSVQHLKEKFGDGYTILIRTNMDTNRKTVIDYIQKQIPEAIIKEEHNKMMHFRVSINVSLYQIFSILEKARDELKSIIEDYTVTQVTLDDIFVNFAKVQEENQISKETSQDENSFKLLPKRSNVVKPI